MKKKICVVTGSRAEYGLLYPLLKELKKQEGLKTQLVATGMHLSARFGLTYKEILLDGFKIDRKVKMLSSRNDESGISDSIGNGVSGFTKAFQSLKPELVVLLGDRFEIFSAALAAYIANIPVAHIHGGETTEGAFDEGLRHAITKMSVLHFTATRAYRRRVIQLGEEPKRVFNVGALAIDNIRDLPALNRKRLEKELRFSLGRRSVLVTFHPATLEKASYKKECRELLLALDAFPDLKVIFTMPNADPHAREIEGAFNDYVRHNPLRAARFVSLGRVKYLSLLKYVDAVVGNSSSGIIEAPSFGVPCVNIGSRQKGRIRAGSIIDSPCRKQEIQGALRKAFSAGFRAYCKKVRNPYGRGGTAAMIARIIRIKAGKLSGAKKKFYDLKVKERHVR